MPLRGEKRVEVPTLLEASLQIHLFLPHFCLVEALLRLLQLVCEGVSVHVTHVVNTVGPLLSEVPDKKVAFIFRNLWRCWMLTVFF